jgi:hypothetical protein
MARQTDGISQYLVSASALALSGSSKLTVGSWMWWDAFSTVGNCLLQYGDSGVSSGEMFVKPNNSNGDFLIAVHDASYTPAIYPAISWPTSGTWHHYILSIDRALAGAAQITNFWLDGSAPPPGYNIGAADVSSNWGNFLLYLMTYDSAPVTGGYGAGRIAEVVLYSGYNFTGTDAGNLYNGGAGRDARTVQTPTYYWPLLGQTSPEPALVGGIAMTVSGATAAAHPISIWGQPAANRMAKDTPGLAPGSLRRM